MLTKGEADFLTKIPPGKKVSIYPYDPKVRDTVEYLITSIKNLFSNLEIKHMGASALKISGQNDIDIYTLNPFQNSNS